MVKNQGKSEPEFRLPSTVAGALIVPVGLFGGCILITILGVMVADIEIDVQDLHGLRTGV